MRIAPSSSITDASDHTHVIIVPAHIARQGFFLHRRDSWIVYGFSVFNSVTVSTYKDRALSACRPGRVREQQFNLEYSVSVCIRQQCRYGNVVEDFVCLAHQFGL
jgi:hypothetical protein